MLRSFSPRSAGRKSVFLVLSTAALLAVSGCASAPPPPAPVAMAPSPPAPPAPTPPPPPPPVTSPDQQFIDQAAAAGMTEVALGHLVEQQTKRRDVRAFAHRMVIDHTRIDDRLMALARRLHMMSAEPPAADQQAQTQLASAEGPDFDKTYLDGQIEAHKQAIQLYDGEAKAGQNRALAHFARETLPTLRSHLREAERVSRRLGH
jgi:putative membrane protein